MGSCRMVLVPTCTWLHIHLIELDPLAPSALGLIGSASCRPGDFPEGRLSGFDMTLSRHGQTCSHGRTTCHLGQRLQAGSKIRHFAYGTALLRRTGTDQIADHDQSAGDAEPHVQRVGRRELADRVDDRKPGPHRPFGIVLVRLRIAEIDQHSIAKILSDKAGECGARKSA
jgi:hypothetical protein